METRRNVFRAAGAAIAGFFTGTLMGQTKISIGPIRGRVGPYLLGIDAAGRLVAISPTGTVALVPAMPGGALQLVGSAGSTTIPTLQQLISEKVGPGFVFIGPDKKLSAVSITAVDILNTTEPATIEVMPIP